MLEFYHALVSNYHAFVNSPDIWKYLSIPVVAAIVGWGTNWVAIQMTFYPIHFLGIPPWLGWQGIIPRKGRKMAGIVVENTLEKISTMQEIFDEFEPEKIAHHVIKVADSRIEELTDDIMTERNACPMSSKTALTTGSAASFRKCSTIWSRICTPISRI